MAAFSFYLDFLFRPYELKKTVLIPENETTKKYVNLLSKNIIFVVENTHLET